MAGAESAPEDWTVTASKCLSLLMDNAKCKALLNTDFYDNAGTEWTEKRLYFNQIKSALSNDQYPSINAVFLDIDTLFQNALTISDNGAASDCLQKSDLLEMYSIFKEYCDSYQSQSEHPNDTMEIEEKENTQTSDHQTPNEPENGEIYQQITSNDNLEVEQGDRSETLTQTNGVQIELTDTDTVTETEHTDNNADHQTVTIKSRDKSRRKTRNITNITSVTRKRRRSARIAKKNARVDSDDNELNIYIGINVGKGIKGRKKRATTPSSKAKKRKRNYSTMNSQSKTNGDNHGEDGEESHSVATRKTRKVARLSAAHSSPNHDDEDGMVSTEIEVESTESIPKKRRRSRRHSRRRSSDSSESADNLENVKTDNEVNTDDNEDSLSGALESEMEVTQLTQLTQLSNSETSDVPQVHEAESEKSSKINIIVMDERDENEDDDDVDMKPPPKQEKAMEISQVTPPRESKKYNLRSNSRSKMKPKVLKLATSPIHSVNRSPTKSATKSESKSPSKSLSKTLSINDEVENGDDMSMPSEIALNHSNPSSQLTQRRTSPRIRRQNAQKAKSTTPLITETTNTREPSLDSVTESTIDFEDGMEDSLCGKFEHNTNMQYSCKAFCINGEFKPFNQDWVSLDRFDQFKDQKPIIFCGAYDGHGILGHNASKYVARHLPKEFMFDLFDLKNQQRSKYGSVSPRASSVSSSSSRLNVDDENEQNEDESNVLEQALRSALHRVDEEMREISRNETTMFSTILTRNGCEGRLIDYGTTVNCLVSDGEHIVVLNVGDSRCILVEGFHDESNAGKWKWTCRAVTSDHNPVIRKDEVERVCNENGRIHVQGQEMRLFPKGLVFREARRKGLAINMSRAVGHSTLCQHGLVAEPEVYRIAVEADHEYIFVMASDGVWDVVGNEEVFGVVQQICGSSMHDQTETTIEEEIAVEILESAEGKWRKRRQGDNVSVVVTRIVKRP